MCKSDEVNILKEQLVQVLTELDKISRLKFMDVDCDGGCVYNFSDVVYDENDDSVYLQIAMWHDNLPSHKCC